MDILELFNRSKSQKSFSPEALEPELLQSLARVGLSALDPRQLDAIRILLVTSPNWLDKIHMAFPHGWFTEAPHVIAVIENSDKRSSGYQDSWSHIEIEVGKMIGRMELFASANDLAFATVYDFDPLVVHRGFGLGTEERFLALMALGRQSEFMLAQTLHSGEEEFHVGKNKIIGL